MNIQTFGENEQGNLSDILNDNDVVLVDFWAEWCAPCKEVVPILDTLAEEFDGKVVIGKVNIDESFQLSVDHKITAIPTILIFKGGQEAERFVGIESEKELRDALNEVVD